MAYQFDIKDEVTYGMQSALTMLHPISLPNAKKELIGVFFDIDRKVALAGYRRQVANFGTLLVKATYQEGAQLSLPNGDVRMTGSGIYNMADKEFYEEQYGLLGGEGADGENEIVDVEKANEKFNDVIGQVAMRHKALLDPNGIYNFMNKVIKSEGRNGTLDRKINIQFTANKPPQKTFIAEPIADESGHLQLITYIKKKDHIVPFPMYVSKDSPIKEGQLKRERQYLIQPSRQVDPNNPNVRFCDVLRPHVTGIRMAVQHIKNGTKRPGSYGYMVDANEAAGVKKTSVGHMRFAQNQDTRFLENSPMLTIDLDNFHALMEVFKAYDQVEMHFKDSSTGIYFKAEGNMYTPHMEAILSPTIHYVNGKVCLK